MRQGGVRGIGGVHSYEYDHKRQLFCGLPPLAAEGISAAAFPSWCIGIPEAGGGNRTVCSAWPRSRRLALSSMGPDYKFSAGFTTN